MTYETKRFSLLHILSVFLTFYTIQVSSAKEQKLTLTSNKARPEAIKEKKKMEKQEAILAGGCFWGVEELLRKLKGVLQTEVGYTGGATLRPTYNDVKTGTTGHAEAIRVVFDPSQISYEDILKYFFRLHDPTTVNRQGNDRGTQYRSAIFYNSPEQKETAERVITEVDRSKKWKNPVVTAVVPASEFYPAEEYHQDYLQKNPGGYTCHFLRD